MATVVFAVEVMYEQTGDSMLVQVHDRVLILLVQLQVLVLKIAVRSVSRVNSSICFLLIFFALHLL